MDIKLYYIEGISKLDTPYFSTLSEQVTYFDKHVIKTIINTYYPPFYKNSIRFDKDDCDFNTHINYIGLVDDDKTYYYFITNMTYNNQGVITLDIEMDSVQTYLFNTDFKSTTIERKFIDRWNSDKSINRNYIRENISKGIFSNVIKNYCNSSIYDPWVIIKTRTQWFSENEHLGESRVTNGILRLENDDNKNDYVPTPYRYYFAPLNFKTYKSGSSTYTFSGKYLINEAVEDTKVLGIYVIPFCPIEGITFDNDGNILSIGNTTPIFVKDYTATIKIYCLRGVDFVYPDVTAQNYDIRDITSIYSFPFLKNTSTSIYFNSNFVPSLLDENYYRIFFGDGGTKATFPTYNLINVNAKLSCWCDLMNGNRYYKISNENVISPFDDKYYSIQMNGSPLSYDLVNDAWKEYLSQNHATLATGILRTGLNFASIFAGKVNSVPETLHSASSTITPAINAVYTPDSIRQTGYLSQDFFQNASHIFIEVNKVNDFDYCAQYYHHYGYLVNEFINSTSSLATYCNTRYYYNYIKVSDITTHINMLEADNITDTISKRYKDGVRFWNVLSSGVTIGDYRYDNVEKIYL